MEKELNSRIESMKLHGNRTRAEAENKQEKWFINILQYKKYFIFHHHHTYLFTKNQVHTRYVCTY